MKRLLLLPTLLAAILAAVSCLCGPAPSSEASSSARGLTTPIADILENPARYSDEVVTVKGVVSGSLGVFSSSGFILSDRTGSIAVFCPSSMAPGEGETVKIRGTVHLVYRFKDNSFCYIKQIKSK